MGSGFYTFTLDYTDTTLLEDDTYSYTLTQDGVYLKNGFIRLIETDEGILDTPLNSLLA